MICSSPSGGNWSVNSLRAYAGVCNSPGINRHSYLYRLSAPNSSNAHCRNQLASPFRRVRCFAAARITPNASRTLSARSAKSGGGRRRPCSMLARRVGLYRLHTWGIPYLSDASEPAALIIGELTANAVTHGRIPGRDFALCLTHTPGDREILGGAADRDVRHPKRVPAAGVRRDRRTGRR
ncbi:protein of unknown function [Streptomyces sp. KY75]|nr:protein of unknown function [Streptomyces sp. KY70]CAD5988971.1 protein of unknown function [Streptomyces sp. KY75]